MQHVHCRWQGHNVVLINRESDSSSVKLCSLPPTGVSFIGNVHRCHLQVAIWKVALLESPLNMNSKMARILTTNSTICYTLGISRYTAAPYNICKEFRCRSAGCCSKLWCTILSIDERVAKQGIIHSKSAWRQRVWIYNWGTTWGYWCHIVGLTYSNIFLWICY